MTWRLAKSLDVLRTQVNSLYPNRSKVDDGTIGDERHSATVSDHNPNSNGVVTAMDITHDPVHGLDAGKLAEALRLSRDSRIKYIISNRRIASSKVSPWVWRPYSGANSHEKHVHVSVMGDSKLYDDISVWHIGAGLLTPPVVVEQPHQLGHFIDIGATEFGGEGDEQPSAYADVKTGWPNRPGVALPFRFTGTRPQVRVFRNGKTVDCPIVDVGPWNTNDPYWVLGNRPQSETGTDTRGRKTNKAGIDLTPAAMDALQVPGKSGTRSTVVDWEFITTETAPAPVPMQANINPFKEFYKWILSTFSRS